jgi:thiol-disulfide isomerase/thioredoxin
MNVRTVLTAAVFGLALGNYAEAQSDELETVTAEALHMLIDSHAGNVVVVNFWATWCPPCLREFPDIISVYEDYANQGLTVLAVSMNDAEEGEDIEQFLAEFAPPFPVYRAATVDSDFYDGVLDPWYGEMPMTLVFDREGTLIHAHKKPLTYDELVGDLKPLL